MNRENFDKALSIIGNEASEKVAKKNNKAWINFGIPVAAVVVVAFLITLSLTIGQKAPENTNIPIASQKTEEKEIVF